MQRTTIIRSHTTIYMVVIGGARRRYNMGAKGSQVKWARSNSNSYESGQHSFTQFAPQKQGEWHRGQVRGGGGRTGDEVKKDVVTAS